MAVAVEDLLLQRVTGAGLAWKNIPELEAPSLKSIFKTINIVNNVKYYIAEIKTWPGFLHICVRVLNLTSWLTACFCRGLVCRLAGLCCIQRLQTETFYISFLENQAGLRKDYRLWRENSHLHVTPVRGCCQHRERILDDFSIYLLQLFLFVQPHLQGKPWRCRLHTPFASQESPFLPPHGCPVHFLQENQLSASKIVIIKQLSNELFC